MTEISAVAQIGASPQHVWAILAGLASYPQWNPLFREASGQLTAGSTVTLPTDGGTRLVQTETYRGLLARMSTKSISRTRASFDALNQAIKQRAEHGQQATPE
jgi:hypothetical protein